jgi:hypothetical protein
MATSISVDKGSSGVPDTTGYEAIYQGTITLSGNYGTSTSHGDTLSFSNASILSNSVPNRVEIYEQPAAGTAPSFYTAVYQPGSTIANGAVNFSLAGTEYTEASAYSGAIASAVWKFRAWFPRGK